MPDITGAVLGDLVARGGELVVLLLLMSNANRKVRASLGAVQRQVAALAKSLGVELVDGVHVEPMKGAARG